jgi:hypothetical protein
VVKFRYASAGAVDVVVRPAIRTRETGHDRVDIAWPWRRRQPRIIIDVLRHVVVRKQAAVRLDRIPQHLVCALIIHDRPRRITSAQPKRKYQTKKEARGKAHLNVRAALGATSIACVVFIPLVPLHAEAHRARTCKHVKHTQVATPAPPPRTRRPPRGAPAAHTHTSRTRYPRPLQTTRARPTMWA